MHCFSISSVVLLMIAGIHFSTQQENSADITSQLTKFSFSFFQVSLLSKNFITIKKMICIIFTLYSRLQKN